jgi:hypothetical protein
MTTDSPLRNIIARGAGMRAIVISLPERSNRRAKQTLNVAPWISRLSLCRAVVCAQVIFGDRQIA